MSAYLGSNQHKKSLCPDKGASAQVFFLVGQPINSEMWLALLLAKDWDIETNPELVMTYACKLCNKIITDKQYSILYNSSSPHWVHPKCSTIPLRQNNSNWTCCQHRTDHTTNEDPSGLPLKEDPGRPTNIKKNLKIIQVNINGMQSKTEELKKLTYDEKADIITIQETKLKQTNRTPKIDGFTAVRRDRLDRDCGGLLTYIRNDITFTDIRIPPNIKSQSIELQHIKLNLPDKKSLDIFNLYIPPRDNANPTQATINEDISKSFTYFDSFDRSIITGDINSHHQLWHSPLTDHRGTLIADIIDNSDLLVLNKNTPTKIPTNINHRCTSPDITASSNLISRLIHWTTLNALNSDHKPIMTTFNTRTNFRLTEHRNCYANYKKAGWTFFTNHIEQNFT